MKGTTTWILIANGAKARIVENTGVGKGIVPVDDLVFRESSESASGIMADRPGRVHDSSGARRHAMEYASDPVREREKHFAEMLTDVLESGRQLRKFDRLIVVAAPQAMGDLRASLGSELKKQIHGEIAKDLTHVPNADLPRHLESMLAV